MYFKELDIPYPLQDKSTISKMLMDKEQGQVYRSLILDIENFVSSDLKEVFNSLGLQPNIGILFGFANKKDFISKPSPHTDLIWQNNKWNKVPFALNWELTPTNPIAFWYDIDPSEEIYPDPIPDTAINIPSLQRLRLAHGIRYDNNPTNWEVDHNHKVIEQHIITSNAYAFKSDVPHTFNYSGYSDRLNLSIRFPIEQIPTSEVGFKLFEPYAIK